MTQSLAQSDDFAAKATVARRKLTESAAKVTENGVFRPGHCHIRQTRQLRRALFAGENR
jgi:hypothetical protein